MIVAKQYLETHGIRPSQQRIAVMHYLLTHRTHPSVEEIYDGLKGEYSTLSKTTVYNTLKALSESGAVLTLNIAGTNANYDGYVAPHAHFLCTRCGKIYDVELAHSDLMGKNLPEGSQINDVQLYYKGICGRCSNK